MKKFLLGLFLAIVWIALMYSQLGDFVSSFFLTCDPNSGECHPLSADTLNKHHLVLSVMGDFEFE